MAEEVFAPWEAAEPGRCRRVVTRFRPMARTERRGGSSMPFQSGLCAVITLPEIVLITASPKHAQAHVPSGLFRSSSFRLSGCIASAPTRRAIKMTTTTDRSELLESLTEGISKLTTSDEWQRYLDCQSRFYHYRTGRSDLSQHCEYQLRKRLRVGVQC